MQPIANSDLFLPSRRRWTRDEFARMVAGGLFGPGEHVELVEGEIVEHVTPQNSMHATAVRLVEEALRGWFGADRPHSSHASHDVRVQLPLTLDDCNELEPDVAVVPGSIRDYVDAHPRTAVLVVEVADSSLRYDRATKGALYARAGLAEYWIVNLVDRVLEVHRDPGPLSEQPLGHQYRTITRLTPTDVVCPLQGRGEPLGIHSLLP